MVLALSDLIIWSDSTDYKIYPPLIPVIYNVGLIPLVNIQAVANMSAVVLQDVRCINKINVQGIMVQ